MALFRLISRHKNISIIFLVFIVISVNIYNHSIPTIPTPDEFFAANSHLSKPSIHVKPDYPESRTDDKFKTGDFQLKSGNSYLISFAHEIAFDIKDSESKLIKTTGNVTLYSFGIIQSKLTLIAEFKYKDNDFFKKVSKSLKQELGISPFENDKSLLLTRSVLLKLDPRGILKEMYTNTSNISSDSLEQKLTVVDLLFKKIVSLDVGTKTVTEGDFSGIPFQVKYTITDIGSDQLNILASAKSDNQMGGNEKKAAASGVSGLGGISLKVAQDQNLNWTWNKSQQIPKSQRTQGTTELSYNLNTLAKISIRTQTEWAPDKLNNQFTEKDLEKFKYPVNLNELRLKSKLKNQINFDNRENSKNFVSFSDLLKELKNVNTDKLSGSDKDTLFANLSTRLKDDPSLIQNYKNLAMNASPGSREMSMLLGSLGYEGSAESQAALIDIYNRPGITLDDKQKIMTEFTLPTQPLTEETKNFLKSEFQSNDYLKSDLSSTAGLALGSSIALDGDGNTIRYLHQQWNNVDPMFVASDEQKDKQRFLLSAMGNSKSNVFLDEVKQASSSSDPSMRRSAADAVRFAQDDQSRNLLFDQFIKDPSREVRLMAVEAIRYQPFDERSKNALQSCAISDSEIGVKINCYRALGYRIETTGVREFLQSRLGAESDEQVKNAIIQSLKITEANK